MRTFYIAGNWKMNPPDDPLKLLREVKVKLVGMDKIDLMIAPPFTAIHQASEIFRDTKVHIAGQNLFWEEKGAYTGEISPGLLKSAGADTVIIGHSERRQYFCETDETVNKRVKTALKHNLTPVICIGETAQEREVGITFQVVTRQFEGALAGLSEKEITGIIIAYEPVWAIGTGKVASPQDAQEVHELIRRLLREKYSSTLSETTRILYGGSVNAENAGGLFLQVDIDGALVGGASLSAESFGKIASIAMGISK
jgi:triosephosphate isomerase